VNHCFSACLLGDTLTLYLLTLTQAQSHLAPHQILKFGLGGVCYPSHSKSRSEIARNFVRKLSASVAGIGKAATRTCRLHAGRESTQAFIAGEECKLKKLVTNYLNMRGSVVLRAAYGQANTVELELQTSSVVIAAGSSRSNSKSGARNCRRNRKSKRIGCGILAACS
jgi:hypothetical protein